MTRILLSLSLVVASFIGALPSDVAGAQEAAMVRISLVQAAGSDAKCERIDLTNEGTAPADLTGWRLAYKTASGATTTGLVQLLAEANVHLLLDPGQTESVLSRELVATSAADSPLRQAWQFAGGINHTGGSVQLLDASGAVIDMVGWGASTSKAVAQGDPAPAMTSTTWLRRHAVTGNNAADFVLEPQTAAFPAVIGAVREALDVCGNLEGLQQTAPEGYVLTSDGSCVPLDVCPNIAGAQPEVPTGMEYDTAGACVPIDVCTNLDGVQTEVPSGYELTGARQCSVLLPVRHLVISELLPNPIGADAGNEFIELHNTDTEPAELDNYVLVIGSKTYALPSGVVVAPGEYWTVSDSELGISLPNTTGDPVSLRTIRGAEVAMAPAYKNAPDDASWSLSGDTWQFSYAPTPGAANIALAELPCQAGYERDSETHRCTKVPVPVAVAPCADGQYRSETTGRCRNIISVAGILQPCKEGQYRNETTGRCRSLVGAASVTPKPCADDQFRNPLTDRCKSIASSDDVAATDCGEGRERNPDTHRCRNIVSTTVPAATFAVTPVKEAAKGFVGWWALGGVGLLAAGYGAWEWRRELTAILRGVAARFARK